jgi:hypothetical protein
LRKYRRIRGEQNRKTFHVIFGRGGGGGHCGAVDKRRHNGGNGKEPSGKKLHFSFSPFTISLAKSFSKAYNRFITVYFIHLARVL